MPVAGPCGATGQGPVSPSSDFETLVKALMCVCRRNVYEKDRKRSEEDESGCKGDRLESLRQVKELEDGKPDKMSVCGRVGGTGCGTGKLTSCLCQFSSGGRWCDSVR